MFCHYTNFHTPTSSGPGVTVTKLKAKNTFRETRNVIYLHIQKYDLN